MKYSGFRHDVKRHVLTFSTSGQCQVTKCCACAVTSWKKCHVSGCCCQAGNVCCLRCLVLQRLQHFIRFVYGFPFVSIFHVTVHSLFLSFSFHTCLLSSVSFLLFTCLNDIWLFRYLALNWFAVRPMYVSCGSCVFRYSPSSGHSALFLQLHVFFPLLAAVVLFLCSAVWLCCGHLLIPWRWACSCSWVSGCFC